jgi:type I protein arginine methyltransferase
VNAYEHIRGWMKLSVNNMRSYDIVAELVLGDELPLSSPNDDWGSSTNINADMLSGMDLDPLAVKNFANRRRGKWALHEQTYW